MIGTGCWKGTEKSVRLAVISVARQDNASLQTVPEERSFL